MGLRWAKINFSRHLVRRWVSSTNDRLFRYSGLDCLGKGVKVVVLRW